MFAKRAMAMKTSRLLASLNISDAGILTSGGRSSPGGAKVCERSIRVWSSVLPSAATAILVRSRLRVSPELLIDIGAGGVELGGEPVLNQRFVELAERGKAAALDEVVLGGAQLGAVERQPCVGIVRRWLSACVYSATARS